MATKLVKAVETALHQGGLFRCCFGSAAFQIEQKEEWAVGDQVITECCKQRVQLDEDKVWRVRFENE